MASASSPSKDADLGLYLAAASERGGADGTWSERVTLKIRLFNHATPTRSIERSAP